MSWFGDIFKHMNLDLSLGGSGQRIDIAASSGSRFGYNQGFMCNQFGNRGCDVRIDQNCYGYGRGSDNLAGYRYGPEAGREAAAFHRQEVDWAHQATARTLGSRNYPAYGGDEGCFGRQRGGLSVDFNVGANNMLNNGGRLAMAGAFSPVVGGGQPNISFSLRNFRL